MNLVCQCQSGKLIIQVNLSFREVLKLCISKPVITAPVTHGYSRRQSVSLSLTQQRHHSHRKKDSAGAKSRKQTDRDRLGRN